MTLADFLFLVGAIAAWLLVMCVGAVVADVVFGHDHDLDGPWDPRS